MFIVWDKYKEKGIKDPAREESWTTYQKVTPDTKIPPNWKASLDNTSKKELFSFLSEFQLPVSFDQESELYLHIDT